MKTVQNVKKLDITFCFAKWTVLILLSSEHVPPVDVQIHMKVVLKNTVLRNTEYAGR